MAGKTGESGAQEIQLRELRNLRWDRPLELESPPRHSKIHNSINRIRLEPAKKNPMGVFQHAIVVQTENSLLGPGPSVGKGGESGRTAHSADELVM